MDEDGPDHAARFRHALEQTQLVASTFVGLTESAARARAREHPEAQFVFVAVDSAVTADLRSNRIRLWMSDGVVESASAG